MSALTAFRVTLLDKIARRYPRTTIIGAHLWNPDYAWAGEIARWNPNLFFNVFGSTLIKKQKDLTFSSRSSGGRASPAPTRRNPKRVLSRSLSSGRMYLMATWRSSTVRSSVISECSMRAGSHRKHRQTSSAEAWSAFLRVNDSSWISLSNWVSRLDGRLAAPVPALSR